MSPNAANGYAGLAVVLYENLARRDEALTMLDRARKLDPLEPSYDVTKAVFLFYERSDLKGANDLLVRSCETVGDWNLQVGVLGENGQPIPGLRVEAPPVPVVPR